MLKKINGKYWSSYVQWRNLLYWPLKVVKYIKMPKACPKKSICHFLKTRDDIEMK